MRRFQGRQFPVKAVVFLLLGLTLWALEAARDRGGEEGRSGAEVVELAFREGRSGIVVEVSGEVARILPNDREGSQHQRFILRLAGGHTLLVSHNIDLADRVPVTPGDAVDVRGQYEWNERGGVLHWTHHDPRGRRPGGWIRHRGVTFR